MKKENFLICSSAFADCRISSMRVTTATAKDSANKADDTTLKSRRFTDTARRDFGTCETIIER